MRPVAIALLLSALLGTSCLLPETASATPDDEAPSSPDPPAAADARALSRSHNAAAIDLYRALAPKDGNVVLSPYSIGVAMTMALSGARGETAAEMARVLHQPLPRERMKEAIAPLTRDLSRFGDRKDTALDVANGLCVTGPGLGGDYVALLTGTYAAQPFTGSDVAPINAWVARATHGKIPSILDSLSANSVCVLLNAIYFKGSWALPFDADLTQPDEFHVDDRTRVEVPMMRQTGQFALVSRDDLVAISLPFTAEGLSMVFLLPKGPGGLAQLERALTPTLVESVVEDLLSKAPERVGVMLPRFSLNYGEDLIPALQALGMRLAFSPTEADFGGMTGKEHSVGAVWLGQIRHKAVLEVNEEGSEAAAATAVEAVTRAATARVPSFVADRPFLFLIVDAKSRAILFMGRLSHPQPPVAAGAPAGAHPDAPAGPAAPVR